MHLSCASICNKNRGFKERYKCRYLSTLNRITNSIESRIGTTELLWIPAHQNESKSKIKLINMNKQNQVIKKRFGTIKSFVEGNEQADKLANKGHNITAPRKQNRIAKGAEGIVMYQNNEYLEGTIRPTLIAMAKEWHTEKVYKNRPKYDNLHLFKIWESKYLETIILRTTDS